MEERRSYTPLLAAILIALIAGFAAAFLIFDDDDGNTTGSTVTVSGPTGDTSTTTDGTETTETTTDGTVTTEVPAETASVGSCIELWNRDSNSQARQFLSTIQQPVRIHVGTAGNTPPKCQVTVLANDGSSYAFNEGGGSSFPYVPTPARADGGTLTAEQKRVNALSLPDGKLQASGG